ncbi:MAG TPA: molybdopterin-dependent oxidoreductase, partial [Solirubrobacterales bacterium]|nr:molybdopterin-dependent oxidoreductase [Solirubrobacterales bacterium]
LGSPHLDSRPSRGPKAEVLRRLAEPAISARVPDIDDAEAILVLGTDPMHSMSILDLRIRKAIRRNGAKLVVATERPTSLDGGAEAIARYAPGQAAHFVAELASAIGGAENVASPVAETLRDAGKVVVVWGERIGREDGAAEALLDVAAAVGMADSDGSGLLEVPDTANARGLREAGCLPDAGPGLAETATGMSTEEIRDGLISGEISSLILFGVDPLRDFPDTKAWETALTACDFLVAFSMHENATTAKADVVLPLETHAEKDGTVTHPDGRLQRVRPSASRPGDIRPNIQVLAELAAKLDLDTDITSQPTAFAALTEAVPFYAGITDSDIGGRGLRWQDRQGASSEDDGTEHSGPQGATEEEGRGPTETGATSQPGYVEAGDTPAHHAGKGDASESTETVAEGSPDTERDAPISMVQPEPTPGGVASGGSSATVPPPQGEGDSLLLGTYRDLWAGPVTELNPPLRFLTPQQRLEISPADAARLDLESGDPVRVSQNGSAVDARVQVKERVSEGVVFLAEGLLDGNANALLNGGPVQVRIEKLGEARS